ncbi:cadherin-like domain-containing protein [Mycolicibacterium senegalense]|uniref:Ig-like domain-containing protein n=2 Tax=Mycobacteriaceae TaxID=1762 RepID=UPI001C9A1DB1|nr:Ig-like domain-containing protein [Mycolicibacterium senegalense]QZA26032.1 cadherin-like domain-containing protein [Mycolicibacterium senegalense]
MDSGGQTRRRSAGEPVVAPWFTVCGSRYLTVWYISSSAATALVLRFHSDRGISVAGVRNSEISASGENPRGRHRASGRRQLGIGSWLGAGAITLGVGAALASGSGVAHADNTGSDTSSATSRAGKDTASKAGSDDGARSKQKHKTRRLSGAIGVSQSDGNVAVATTTSKRSGSVSSNRVARSRPTSIEQGAVGAQTDPPETTTTPTVATDSVAVQSVDQIAATVAPTPVASVKPAQPVSMPRLDKLAWVAVRRFEDSQLLSASTASTERTAASSQTVGAEPVVTPATAPSLLQMLQHAFSNKAPTVSPEQTRGQSPMGVVTGNLWAGDPDGDQVTYTVTQQPAHGTVVVNPDGSYRYNPDTDFANTGGTDQFTVSVDGGAAYRNSGGVAGSILGLFHSLAQAIGLSESDTTTVTVPVSVTATNRPPGGIPTPGRPNSAAVVGDDGNVYQTSVESLSSGYVTHVTVVHADGTTTHYSQPGKSYDGVVLGPNGDVYQTSFTDNYGSDFTYYTTTMRVIHADGTTTDYTQSGVGEHGPVVGTDGTIYQAIANGSSIAGRTITVLVVRPDGTSTTHTQAGGISGRVVIGSDGTAYTTSSRELADHGFTTVVVALRPDGTTTEYTLNGAPLDGVILGPNNTAYLNTTVRDSSTMTLDAVLVELHSDGTTTARPGPADQIGGAIVAADGTIYRSGRSGTEPVVSVLHPDGTITTTILPGEVYGPIVLGPNGDAYQTSTVQNTTIVTVLHADGTTTSYTQPGRPVSAIEIGSDGRVYTTSYNLSDGTTTVRALHPDGTIIDYTQPGRPVGGWDLVELASDGTFYQTTGSGGYQTETTMVRAYSPDGTFTDHSQPGQVVGGVVIGPDGTAYQVSVKGETTVVSVLQPDAGGATYELPGSPSGRVVIAGDGTPYLATAAGLWDLSALTSEITV